MYGKAGQLVLLEPSKYLVSGALDIGTEAIDDSAHAYRDTIDA